ncbi:5-hydroxytryptamine receptor 3A-like [Cheilinus undulatus]|uniref:5-hydroxytryptamine receptor 3A-like n=1 Tax=Cheilinus undulatus TaxID=241271 RepID=UPI001BD6A65C|nr:5-hydroxytryptamine receptor 3A-like [Cheilinus undulatus]
MMMFFTNSGWTTVLFLTLLTAGHGDAQSTTCVTRRCLAEALIKRGYSSQPQNHNCTQTIQVPFVEYQTLSVRWNDPELTWDPSVYPFDEVVLPVAKVWTPELHVTNGILTTMKHSSRDLIVHNNGTIVHSVVLSAEVNCEVNLFNYPYAADECPVAIQTWYRDGCGTSMDFGGELKVVDGTHGDWQTEYAYLEQQLNRDDRNYIRVGLRVKYLNPFITLMLPSILLVLADVVSFALPLGGGERNCFKVTLVLSFTMFLIILNDVLPGDSHCSPIIRTHFCICLVFLVFSMLVSMVLTGLAGTGSLVFCCWPKKGSRQGDSGSSEEREDEEVKADISVVQLNASEGDSRMLSKVVSFLEELREKTQESERYEKIATTVDKIFFWCYLIIAIAYFITMTLIMTMHTCIVNHFDFWY